MSGTYHTLAASGILCSPTNIQRVVSFVCSSPSRGQITIVMSVSRCIRGFLFIFVHYFDKGRGYHYRVEDINTEGQTVPNFPVVF